MKGIETHRDVIQAFGGQAALARALGVPPTRACHWNDRGIPAKLWHKVEALGRSSGVPVTCGLLAAAPKRQQACVRDKAA